MNHRQSRWMRAALSACLVLASATVMAQEDRITAELERIEQTLEARIGFAAHNIATGQRWGVNADEALAVLGDVDWFVFGRVVRVGVAD